MVLMQIEATESEDIRDKHLKKTLFVQDMKHRHMKIHTNIRYGHRVLQMLSL